VVTPRQRDGRPVIPKGTRVVLDPTGAQEYPRIACLVVEAIMCVDGRHVVAYTVRSEATKAVTDNSGRVTGYEPQWFEAVPPEALTPL